jgi:hypothetical protein
LALALGALILVGIFLATAVTSVMCGSKVGNQLLSPDTRYKAQTEQSDCGAITGFETEVVLIENRPRLGLSLFGHASHTVVTVEAASTHLRLYWATPDVLIVECSQCKPQDVHVWDSSWKQVSVKYIYL